MKKIKSKKNFLQKLKFISVKKLIVFTIVAIIGISMLLTMENFNFKTDDNKWIKVGSKSTVANVIYGEYASYVEQNYLYIQQNPFLLAKYLNNLISQYITMLLFANEAESINLAVDEKEVIKTISSIPYFQNEDGSFNREEFLRRVNLIFGSEKIFLANVTDNMLRDQIEDTITPLLQQPYYLGYLDYLSLTQERTVKYIELPESVVKNIPKPTIEELQNILDNNKDKFTLPERRNAEYIVIHPEKFASFAKVSDKEIKNYYEEHKDYYLLDELRNVSQITFDNKKDAEKAYKTIKRKKLDNIKDKYTVIDMGEVDYESLPEEMSKAIFATPSGEVSIPVESSIGWHIFIVNSISKPQYAKLKDVKEEIKATLLASKQIDFMNSARNEINNMLAKKESLRDIANKFNIEYKMLRNLTIIDASSKGIPNAISNSIFSTESANNSVLIENSEDGTLYAIVVNDIEKTKTQNVEEAKSQLTQMWKNNYINQKRQEIASNIVSSIMSGKNISNLGYNLKTKIVAYSNRDIPFTPESTVSIFLSAKNTPIQGNMNNTNPFVAVVSSIKNPNIQYTDKHGIRNQEITNFTNYISQTYTQTLFSTYADNLNKKFSVKINEKAILEKLAPAMEK